jgi:hypothetical protein
MHELSNFQGIYFWGFEPSEFSEVSWNQGFEV